jgi:protein TonB
MTSSRTTLLWSIALHGGAIGTACALGLGASQPTRPSLRIAILPAEAAIASAPPPVEVVEVETPEPEVEWTEPVESPLEPLEDPAEPEIAAPDEPAFGPVAEVAGAPAWLAVAKPARPTPPTPQVEVVPPLPEPQILEPQMLEPLPAPVTEVANVVEVIPGEDPKPDYPSLARKRGWAGTTEVAVVVDATGAVVEAVVAKSSSYPVLDRAAVRAVRGWRFRGGAGRTSVVVEFRLTSSGPAAVTSSARGRG